MAFDWGSPVGMAATTAGGFAVGGPIGGAMGLAHGFARKGLKESSDAEDEAQNRYMAALNEAQAGTNRAYDWEQGKYEDVAQKSLQNEASRFRSAPTGQQSAAQLQSEYAKALAGAQTTAGPAAKVEAPSAYAEAIKANVAPRFAAAVSPMAHETTMASVRNTAQQAVARYQLDATKLNAQLAQVANTSGMEKAALAARFAAATGQYPLDMMKAQEAGQKNAMYSGLILGGVNLAAKGAGAMGGRGSSGMPAMTNMQGGGQAADKGQDVTDIFSDSFRGSGQEYQA